MDKKMQLATSEMLEMLAEATETITDIERGLRVAPSGAIKPCRFLGQPDFDTITPAPMSKVMQQLGCRPTKFYAITGAFPGAALVMESYKP